MKNTNINKALEVLNNNDYAFVKACQAVANDVYDIDISVNEMDTFNERFYEYDALEILESVAPDFNTHDSYYYYDEDNGKIHSTNDMAPILRGRIKAEYLLTYILKNASDIYDFSGTWDEIGNEALRQAIFAICGEDVKAAKREKLEKEIRDLERDLESKRKALAEV